MAKLPQDVIDAFDDLASQQRGEPEAELLAIDVDAYRPGPGIEVSIEPPIPRDKQQDLLRALQKKGYRIR